jgi:hypothetical protein
MEQKARGYGDQFYSNMVTSRVSRDGIPIKPGPAVPEKTMDSRGVLLRRSVAAVTGSVMCDVTVDSLMNQHTGESIDTSCGVVAEPRSAVVMAVDVRVRTSSWQSPTFFGTPSKHLTGRPCQHRNRSRPPNHQLC